MFLGCKVNTRRMAQHNMGFIFHIKKWNILLCELSKWSKSNAFILLGSRGKLIHLLLFTNRAIGLLIFFENDRLTIVFCFVFQSFWTFKKRITIVFEKKIIDNYINKGLSLTVVNEGLSLTIVNKTTNFIKNGRFWKNDRFWKKLHAKNVMSSYMKLKSCGG